MHQRPIAPLVEALQSMGAEVKYIDKQGYPPLEIRGKKLQVESVEVDASMSSQYVSALLLIGSVLPDGLQIKLRGAITSLPYIQMTLALLQRLGVRTSIEGNLLQVEKASKPIVKTVTVESDWSSASCLYSFFAISKMEEMRLGGLRQDSLQGDSRLQSIFTDFGVKSTWDNADLVLHKTNSVKNSISLRSEERRVGKECRRRGAAGECDEQGEPRTTT